MMKIKNLMRNKLVGEGTTFTYGYGGAYNDNSSY